MSKQQGEPHWQELRQQLLHAWSSLSDDDLDALEQMHLKRSIRSRHQLERDRSDRDASDFDENN